MAVVVYTCDTCKRTIEIPQNKFGVEVIGHCIITDSCNGSLKQQAVKPAYIRGKLPPPDPTGLVDWSPRRVFFNYEQKIAAKKWVVDHNLDTNPSVQVYVYTVDGLLTEAVPGVANYTLTYISPYQLVVEFQDPTVGTVQCIARSTAAATATTTVTQATVGTPTQLITGGNILTIATLSTVSEVLLTLQFISPLFFTPTNTLTIPFSTSPSFLSPWKNAHKLFINGKLYTVRTAVILDDIIGSGVVPASPFYFSNATTVGEVFVLLSTDPYQSVDRTTGQVFDIVDINAGNATSLSSQVNGSLYISDTILRSVYPPIKVVN